MTASCFTPTRGANAVLPRGNCAGGYWRTRCACTCQSSSLPTNPYHKPGSSPIIDPETVAVLQASACMLLTVEPTTSVHSSVDNSANM